MRKVLFEKLKVEITKKDAIEMFKKAVQSCDSYGALYISERDIQYSVSVSHLVSKAHINFSISRSTGEMEVSNPMLNCFVSLTMNPAINFPIFQNEYRELANMVSEKK